MLFFVRLFLAYDIMDTMSKGGMVVSQKGKMMDMTKGNPVKLILFFSLPLLLGNVFQQMYNMVDSIVVGNFVGSSALAAVGTGFPVIFMLSSLFIGLGTGATIMISQYYGAKREDLVKDTVNTINTAMIVAAIPLTIVGMLISGPLLRLMNVPADTFGMAHTYVVIIFAGVVGNLGFNVNSGILQGLGDSKTPLLFLIIASIINTVLDIVFVVVFHWGVAGVAWATIIAQFFSWFFGIWYINKKYTMIHISLRQFSFNKELFSRVLKLGIPAGIQQSLFSIGIMLLQSLVNGYGSNFMAGFNAANKLDTFAFMPIQSFANAATTFVGQNLGANQPDRVKKGTVSTITMSCIFSVIVALLLLPAGPFLIEMFSRDPEVIQSGMIYLRSVMPFYFLLSVLFILNAIMRGAGETIVPMVSILLSLWLIRIPAAYLLNFMFGKEAIFYSYAIGWAVGCLVSVAYFMSGKWKQKVITQPDS